MAWVASIPRSKDRYVALFNTNDSGAAQKVSLSLSELSMKRAGIRDLWTNLDLPVTDSEISASLKPHQSALFRVTPK